MPLHSESFLLSTFNSSRVHISYYPLQKKTNKQAKATNKNSKEEKPKHKDEDELYIEEEKLL